FRPATREDCEQVVQLINACSRVLRGADEITVEGLHSEWEQPGSDLATDTLAAITANGAIVGYADIFDMEEPPVKPLVFGRVHPNYEGRGIGTHLMQWAEIRSRQAIDRVPPGIRVAMKGSTLNRHRPSLQLLQDMGMVPVRYTLEMDIALDTPPVAAQWPAGIAVYTHVEPGDDLAIYRAYREAWQDHRDSVSRSEAQDFPLWQHNMTTDPNYDPSLWFLAREGNEIAAIALCKRLPEEDP